MHYYLDALSEIKLQYFTGNEVDGLEPKCGTVNVVDGTAYGIGHLFAATICHGGTALKSALKSFEWTIAATLSFLPNWLVPIAYLQTFRQFSLCIKTCPKK